MGVDWCCGFWICKQLKERCFFEDGEAEDLEDCVEAGVDSQALLDDGDQHIDGDGDPDLGFDGVLGGAVEALDAQVLLDPFEEQLDLPAAFVELGDGQRRQGEVVGQEGEGLAALGVAVSDAAEPVRVVGGGVLAGGADGLVAAQAGGLVDCAGRDPAELELGPCPDDEEGRRPGSGRWRRAKWMYPRSRT